MKRRSKMKRSMIASTMIALLILSSLAAAEERRGAEILITKKDGTQVSGELVAVKKDSLLLVANEPAAGMDLTVGLKDIKEVKIVKKSKAGKGLLYGLLLGGGGGAAAGLLSGDDPDGFVSFSASDKAALFGIFFGGLGLVIGGIVGGLSGADEVLSIGGISESGLGWIQARLAESARLKGKIY